MKKIIFATIFLVFNSINVVAQEKCMESNKLKKLDASWEKAQLELDYDFISKLLAEDYIWVHNHANTIDDKSAVLERVKRHVKNNNRNTKSRTSKNVNVIIYGSTGVVNGYTIIDRGPKPITYSFMRTYTEKDGKCYLIANHTMAIPDKNKH
ncbi:uncharacterized protein DUF4440 [Lutibacter sp. Hel_I_33_5]|uniref:nuclear transport factor 2 family protein n=1 Tax=Lutibacter sp. Hel_I_33_5 TaxID=1566289 RepID=UPI0011A152EE|nr:nuclear transport factor 2 family protein [Lutibacter sp. Hel_I_33_5]TVZ55396.1 uncharacterized protein DUF4440 [Lutibacter sp. Hel_I_33_5]